MKGGTQKGKKEEEKGGKELTALTLFHTDTLSPLTQTHTQTQDTRDTQSFSGVIICRECGSKSVRDVFCVVIDSRVSAGVMSREFPLTVGNQTTQITTNTS